jgi:hypothetical protein
VGFDSTIAASERAKTVHALDRSATVTGGSTTTNLKRRGHAKNGGIRAHQKNDSDAGLDNQSSLVEQYTSKVTTQSLVFRIAASLGNHLETSDHMRTSWTAQSWCVISASGHILPCDTRHDQGYWFWVVFLIRHTRLTSPLWLYFWATQGGSWWQHFPIIRRRTNDGAQVDEYVDKGFYFSRRISALVKRWRTCAENNWEYVEKWQSCTEPMCTKLAVK